MHYRGFFIDISSDCTECISSGDCTEWEKKQGCSFYSVRIYESEHRAYEFNSFVCDDIFEGEDMTMQLINNFFFGFIDDYLEWTEENDTSPSSDFLNAAYVNNYIYE